AGGGGGEVERPERLLPVGHIAHALGGGDHDGLDVRGVLDGEEVVGVRGAVRHVDQPRRGARGRGGPRDVHQEEARLRGHDDALGQVDEGGEAAGAGREVHVRVEEDDGGVAVPVVVEVPARARPADGGRLRRGRGGGRGAGGRAAAHGAAADVGPGGRGRVLGGAAREGGDDEGQHGPGGEAADGHAFPSRGAALEDCGEVLRQTSTIHRDRNASHRNDTPRVDPAGDGRQGDPGPRRVAQRGGEVGVGGRVRPHE